MALAVGVFRFRTFRVLIPRRQRQPVGFVDAPHVSWAGAENVLSGSVVWRITCPAALVNFPQGIGDIPIELIYQLAVTGKVHLTKTFIIEGTVQPMGVANGAAEIGITSARVAGIVSFQVGPGFKIAGFVAAALSGIVGKSGVKAPRQLYLSSSC